MENFNIWYGFTLTLFLLYLFLGIFYFYYTHKTLMKRKGYTDKYVDFLIKDVRSRVIGIGIALPVIIVVAGFITSLIFGQFNISEGKHMLLFFILFFIFVLPFPILDNRKTQKKYKELALESNSEVVLDFNYKQLHRIFNPLLELPTTVFFIALMVYFLRDFHISFLHLLILWILYFTLRSARYMIKPSIRDAYSYTFFFMVINQGLLIFYLSRECISMDLNLIKLTAGMALLLFLILKLVYYIIGFASVKHDISR